MKQLPSAEEITKRKLKYDFTPDTSEDTFDSGANWMKGEAQSCLEERDKRIAELEKAIKILIKDSTYMRDEYSDMNEAVLIAEKLLNPKS